MKFGLLHLFESAGDRGEQQMLDEQIALMQAAETYGFDSVWTAEHHFSEYGFCASPALALAAVAKTTSKVRLCSGVVVLPFHNPIRVAEEFSMLDLLTDGRIELGVGRGYQPAEFEGYGVDQTQSTEMFDEALEIILKAWTEETFSYQGKHFQYQNVSIRPRPLQQPRPPIWMAAVSESSFEKAGRYGLNLLCSPVLGGSLLESQQSIATYWETLEKHGHDPETHEVAALCAMYCGETTDQAREQFAEPVTWFFQNLGKVIAPKVGQPEIKGYEGYQSVRDMLTTIEWDQLLAHGAVLCGDPDYMVEQMQTLKQNYGVNHVLGWTRVGGISADLVASHMERMQKRVMPQLR
ncbi:MAG: LLM class flavin-dependent oxidoreductase [Immundisolibacteraceae bacterium]|nr:LLM class flavin-dependent oxidoreductase [Immundisolibacteraceae bacterium]